MGEGCPLPKADSFEGQDHRHLGFGSAGPVGCTGPLERRVRGEVKTTCFDVSTGNLRSTRGANCCQTIMRMFHETSRKCVHVWAIRITQPSNMRRKCLKCWPWRTIYVSMVEHRNRPPDIARSICGVEQNHEPRTLLFNCLQLLSLSQHVSTLH